MNKHTDDMTSAALRELDRARATALTEAERSRAEATFARIVATPAQGPVSVEPGRRRRSKKVLLGSAGLAGAAGIAVPALLLGGSAYGSWTPRPEPLTGAEAAEAASDCRTALEVPDHGERVAVAERRGKWTYVLVAGKAEASCLMPDDFDAPKATTEGGFLGTYDPDPPAAPALEPDAIDETSSMGSSTDEGWVNWTDGYVGSDVTGVTVHTSSGLDIEASVVGNRFAAWWPGVVQSSSNPEGETWSYTLTLTDGSTRHATG